MKQWIEELRSQPEFGKFDLRPKTLKDFIRNHENKFEAAHHLATEIRADYENERNSEIESVFVAKLPSSQSSSQQISSICPFYDHLYPVLAPRNINATTDLTSKDTLMSSNQWAELSQMPASESSELSSPGSSIVCDDDGLSESSRCSPDVGILPPCPGDQPRPTPRSNIVSALDLPRPVEATNLSFETAHQGSSREVIVSSVTTSCSPPAGDNDQFSDPAVPQALTGDEDMLRRGHVLLPNSKTGAVASMSDIPVNTTSPDDTRYDHLAEELEMLDVTDFYGYYLRTIEKQKRDAALRRVAELTSAMANARDELDRSDSSMQIDPVNSKAPLSIYPKGDSFCSEITAFLRNMQNSLAFDVASASDVIRVLDSSKIQTMKDTIQREEAGFLLRDARALQRLCCARLKLCRLSPRTQRLCVNSKGFRRKHVLGRNDQRSPLRLWYLANAHQPYPDRKAKLELSKSSGLTVWEVEKWFQNARLRVGRGIIPSI